MDRYKKGLNGIATNTVANILTVEIQELKIQRKELDSKIEKLSTVLKYVKAPDEDREIKVGANALLRESDRIALKYFDENIERWVKTGFVTSREFKKGYIDRGGMMGGKKLIQALYAYCMDKRVCLEISRNRRIKGKVNRTHVFKVL